VTTTAIAPERNEQPAASPAARDNRERIWRVALAGITAVGLAIRVVFVVATRHLLLWGDASYYHYTANLLVSGHGLIVPYQWLFFGKKVAAADHPPLYTLYLAAFSFVGIKSWLSHRLVSTLLGGASVWVIGLLGREVGGPAHGRRVGLIAAGIAAVYPYLFMNDGVGMSESMVILTCTVAVLFAYRVMRRPSLARAAWMGLACGLATMTRPEQVLLFALLALPAIALARSVDLRRRARMAVLCLAVGAAPIVPWMVRNARTFHHPVLLSTNFDVTLQVSNCPSTFDHRGPFYAFWDFQCLPKVNLIGDETDQAIFYRHQAVTFISHHKRDVPGVVAARLGRFFNLYRPNQQTVFDAIEGRPRWLSLIGLGGFYLMALAALAGALALRRQRTRLFPLLAVPITVTLAIVLTFPNTRYRAPAEVTLVVLTAVAISAFLARGGRVLDLGVPTVSNRDHRFPLFDGYRALAALAVVAVHVGLVSAYTFRHRTTGPYIARLDAGVALFFLISGFLLYRPFVRSHLSGQAAPRPGAYLKRRALRILPAYWFALTIIVFVLHLQTIQGRRGFVIYYGLLQIYFPKYLEGGISQAWSLCTEISFYLFLPLYAWALRGVARRLRQSLIAVEVSGLVALYGGAMLWRYLVVSSTHHSSVITDSLDWLPANADLFALGMLLAVISVSAELGGGVRRLAEAAGRHAWVWWTAAAVSFWVVSTRIGLPRDFRALPTGPWMGRQILYGLTAFFLLIPGIFGRTDAGLGRKMLAWRWVQFLGLISYGIYLWHEAAIDEFRRWVHMPMFGGHVLGMTIVTIVFSVIVASVSYVVVERPALRMKDRSFRALLPSSGRRVAPDPLVISVADGMVVDAPIGEEVKTL
jgi:peptidoglycan/LPS O-acetylase OafA/YrhL/4-amino-4-deoxy-L-arabinose transferase-like glycosyltransferase